MRENEKLLAAMSYLDEEFISEAELARRPKSFTLRKFSLIAALFVFIIGASLILRIAFLGNIKGGSQGSVPPDFSENSSGGILEDGTDEGNNEEDKVGDEGEETEESSSS